MSKFCLAEIVTLLIGWVSNLLFVAYSLGYFEKFGVERLINEEFVSFAAVLAFPYLLTFLCCWLSHRFVKEFLLLSLALTIGSTVVYYGFFVTQRPFADGWIFLEVPMTQTLIAAAYSFVVIVLSLVFRAKVEPVLAEQPAS